MAIESLRLPVDVSAYSSQAVSLAADLHLPDGPAAPVVFFCFPGGSYNRRYYGLEGPGGHSFGAAMAAADMISIAIDHVGIGDSTRPEDGFAFTPTRIAAAEAAAVEALKAKLRAGTLVPGLPALPRFLAVGVGHSMGGAFVLLQQAQAQPYDALLVLGSSADGLLPALTEEERRYVEDRPGILANLPRLAQLRFGQPFPPVGPIDPNFASVFAGADADATRTVETARDRMLAMGGLMSMIPGALRQEAAAVGVPLFLGFGDRDVLSPPHRAVANFTGAGDITFLMLADTGHMHFGFPTAPRLFRRIVAWARGLGGP